MLQQQFMDFINVLSLHKLMPKRHTFSQAALYGIQTTTK